jgi:hypothetical protein
MTPPPDPRRSEVLAKRRTTQVEAAITLARTLLGQRKLEEALDACQQALTLDETHAGALELEEEIQTALRIEEGVEIAADDSIDSALTTAADPSSLSGLMHRGSLIRRPSRACTNKRSSSPACRRVRLNGRSQVQCRRRRSRQWRSLYRRERCLHPV